MHPRIDLSSALFRVAMNACRGTILPLIINQRNLPDDFHFSLIEPVNSPCHTQCVLKVTRYLRAQF